MLYLIVCINGVNIDVVMRMVIICNLGICCVVDIGMLVYINII